MTVPYRKKLIEAALPLAAISEAAAREKTIHTSGRLAFGDRVLPGFATAAVANANELPLPSRPLARRPLGLQWTPSALKAFSALGETSPAPSRMNPAGDGAASSPVFRARASLVQTGCPSAPPSLTASPPLLLGLSSPLRQKSV
jgi:hypothetical protein